MIVVSLDTTQWSAGTPNSSAPPSLLQPRPGLYTRSGQEAKLYSLARKWLLVDTQARREEKRGRAGGLTLLLLTRLDEVEK
jgi:hypothetical protein